MNSTRAGFASRALFVEQHIRLHAAAHYFASGDSKTAEGALYSRQHHRFAGVPFTRR